MAAQRKLGPLPERQHGHRPRCRSRLAAHGTTLVRSITLDRRHGIRPSPHRHRRTREPDLGKSERLLPFRDGSETQIIGNIMFKRTTLLALTLIGLLGAMPLLSACHTTAGAGKDISKVGDKIEEEAVENTP